MHRLSSGTRYGPRWPVQALNALGGAARFLGLFPRLSDPDLLDAIERQFGASSRNDPWVEDLRRVRLRSFDEDANLSLFGALAVRAQVRQCYANTLAFDRLLIEHPEIALEKIDRPLFVIGWPRTGTTALQRLLSLHKDARFLPVWEGYSPLPDRDEVPGDPRGRKARARRAFALLNWLAPELKAIHPMTPDDPDECYHLFRNYGAMLPGWDFAYLPGYWKWFNSGNAVPAYRLHKRQLQILQSINRKGHWVLKSPQHLAGLAALMQVYPDARLVVTHRDPVESIASYCSLLAVTWGMISEKVDLDDIARYALDMAATSEGLAEPVLRKMPRSQVYHVHFNEFARNPHDTAVAIYRHFDYPYDTGLRARMRAWSAENPRDRHGTHKYDLADFGLTPQSVRRALAKAAAA